MENEKTDYSGDNVDTALKNEPIQDDNNVQSDASQKKKFRVLPLIIAILVAIMPGVVLYANNATEVSLVEMLIVVGGSAVPAIVLYFISLLIFREPYSAGTFSSLCMFLFMNFNFVLSALAWLPDDSSKWVGFALCAAIIIAVFLILLLKARHSGTSVLKTITVLVSIALVSMLLINTVVAAPSIYKRYIAARPKMKTGDVTITDVTPNFYYIITDEFFAADMMKKYYDTDIYHFYYTLRNMKFNVSDFSYNLWHDTCKNMSNNYCLDYICDDKTIKEDDALTYINDTSAMFVTFEKLGYTQKVYSTRPGLFKYTTRFADSMVLATDNTVFSAVDENDNNFLSIVMDNTMAAGKLWGISKPVESEEPKENTSYAENMFRFFDLLEGKEFPVITETPTANYIYICSPHVSFFCDADGNVLPEEEKYNWTDRQVYIDQQAYVIKRLTNIVSHIIENDPNSVIVLQSDHGVHTHTVKRLDVYGPIIEDNDGRRILNAVYFGGGELDINGMSGVNTLRTIMTRLGGNFPPVEDVDPFFADD